MLQFPVDNIQELKHFIIVFTSNKRFQNNTVEDLFIIKLTQTVKDSVILQIKEGRKCFI